jgi:hypothetical protein
MPTWPANIYFTETYIAAYTFYRWSNVNFIALSVYCVGMYKMNTMRMNVI